MVRAAERRGVYLYLDRRIFCSTNDMTNLNAFLSAAPPNAACQYIRAISSDGQDSSWRLHKSARLTSTALSAGRGKGGGRQSGPVSYVTGIGRIEQAERQESGPAAGELGAGESGQWPDEEALEDAHGLGTRRRYRMRVMYDGSNYNGWQLQPHQPSVQGLVETVLSRKLQQSIRIVGASRTDTGVHARGQMVHFDCVKADMTQEETAKFVHQLNLILPSDVRVSDLELAPEIRYVEHVQATKAWHAIFCARGKLYSYRIFLGDTLDPLDRIARYREFKPVNVSLLYEAAACFQGTHDFAAFTNNPRDKVRAEELQTTAGATVRSIRKVEVVDEGAGKYRLDFYLDGALYRMVRNIVGAILAVSYGRLLLQDIQALLDGSITRRQLRKVWNAAPAHGLCLERVYYEDLASD